MIPVVAFTLLRVEINKVDVTLVQRFVRGIMIAIIISMVIVSPFSMSGFYWPAVLATDSGNTTASVADSLPPDTNGTSTTEDTTSSDQLLTSTDDGTPPDTSVTEPVEDTTSS